MRLCIEPISATLQGQPNFAFLQKFIAEFQSDDVTGFAMLTSTDFLKHLRLMFFGTGSFSDTVLYGPPFSPLLIEIPALVAELRESVEEFLRQIGQLGDVQEPSPEEDSQSRKIILFPGVHRDYSTHRISRQ